MIGYIYKIYHIDNPLMIYIGATTRCLLTRLQNHKGRWKFFKANSPNKIKTSYYSLFKIFDKYGNTVNIELIKEYNITDKLHLNVYESLMIYKYRQNKNFEIVNKSYPFGIKRFTVRAYYLNTTKYDLCEVCNKNINTTKFKVLQHSKTKKHQTNLRYLNSLKPVVLPETIYCDEEYFEELESLDYQFDHLKPLWVSVPRPLPPSGYYLNETF